MRGVRACAESATIRVGWMIADANLFTLHPVLAIIRPRPDAPPKVLQLKCTPQAHVRTHNKSMQNLLLISADV